MAKSQRTHLTALKQQATEWLEADGWTVGDAERILRVGQQCVSYDFMGFADLVCVRHDQTLAVQVTDDAHVAEHRAKMVSEPRMRSCLLAGWMVELWGIRSSRNLHLPPIGWSFLLAGKQVDAMNFATVLSAVTIEELEDA